jgi:hypothetical protein
MTDTDIAFQNALLREEAAFRAAMRGVWPTPLRLDAAKFAGSEAGECCDADLRSSETWLRNNARTPEPTREAAQLGMMICTALLDTDPAQVRDLETRLLGCVMRELGYAIEALADGRNGEQPLRKALGYWVQYAAHFGHPMDLLRDEHARLQAKWKAVQK